MGENPRSGSGLHSILTSSQSHRWAENRSFQSMIFMVSSRDRNCQRIEMTREVIARAPPPAFLFPNQQCQRPRAKAPRTASQQNHPFSARCRRRRLSIQPRIPCQTVFCKTVRTNPPNPPEGKPSRPKRPSREDHQSSQPRNSQELLEDFRDNLQSSQRTLPTISGRAVSSEATNPCQPAFSLLPMSWPKPLRRTIERRRSP